MCHIATYINVCMFKARNFSLSSRLLLSHSACSSFFFPTIVNPTCSSRRHRTGRREVCLAGSGGSERYASDAIAIQDPVKGAKESCKQDTSSDQGCCRSIRNFCQEGSRKLMQSWKDLVDRVALLLDILVLLFFSHTKGPCYLLVYTFYHFPCAAFLLVC